MLSNSSAPKKILITGAEGLLGSNLCRMYSKNNTEKYEVYATSKTKPNFPHCQNYKLDILNKEDLKLIEKLKPDVIVHCAALVNLDYCELHPEEAKKVNAEGAKNLALAAKKAGSYLVHISTDAIFDGTKGNYKEEDLPNPISVYGKTKLLAEKEVSSSGAKYVSIRTNIYGWNKKEKLSLAEWMLNKLEKNEKLTAFKDVFFSPILVNNLGEAILELSAIKHQGILHVAGSESCSKLEFARKIAQVFDFNDNLITEISVDDLNLKAKRTKNMSLNVEKAKTILKTKLWNVKEGLKQFKELREER